ncbi:hypothetical protein LLG95_17840 [bacterium]|nr:hypothetical protein [bacterium]
MSDWRPAPPPKRQSGPVRLTTAHNDSITPEREAETYESPQPQSMIHAPGAILALGEHTLAIFKQSVPDKGYDLVYTLLPGGMVKLQGVALNGHSVQEIGTIGQPYFDQLQSQMRWNRDLIVFHCYRYEDVAKIPAAPGAVESVPASGPEPQPVRVSTANPSYTTAAQPSPQQAYQPAPPPPPEDPRKSLKRGQRIQVRFGHKAWDAVYWGQDDQGQVVAHQTYNNWSLMHLDLDRFADSNVLIDPNADEGLIHTIEQSLNNGTKA